MNHMGIYLYFKTSIIAEGVCVCVWNGPRNVAAGSTLSRQIQVSDPLFSTTQSYRTQVHVLHEETHIQWPISGIIRPWAFPPTEGQVWKAIHASKLPLRLSKALGEPDFPLCSSLPPTTFCSHWSLVNILQVQVWLSICFCRTPTFQLVRKTDDR